MTSLSRAMAPARHDGSATTRVRLVVTAACFLGAVWLFPALKVSTLVNAASVIAVKQSSADASLARALADAADAHPTSAAYRKQAHLALLRDDVAQATAVLRAATARYPDDQLLALEAGDAFASAGDWPQAAAQWQRVNMPPRVLLAYGLVYHLPTQQLSTQQRRELLVQLWPDSSSMWYLLGTQRWNEGDVEGAIQHFSKAATLDRGWSSLNEQFVAHLYLAFLLERVGRDDTAAEHYRICLALAQAHPALASLFTIAQLRNKLEQFQ